MSTALVPNLDIFAFFDQQHPLYERVIQLLENLEVNRDFEHVISLLKNSEQSLRYYCEYETESIETAETLASYFEITANKMAEAGIRHTIPPQRALASNYPIARAFCREIRNADLAPINALRAKILLSVALQKNTYSDSQLAEISRQLDLIITKPDTRQAIVKKLVTSLTNREDSIINEFKQVVQDNQELASKYKPLSSALELIFALKISSSKIGNIPKAPTLHPNAPRSKISVRTRTTKIDTTAELDEAQPHTAVNLDIETLRPTLANIDPEPELFISPVNQNAEDDGDALDEAEVVRHTTQTTSRWYSNLVNRTPVSSTRLSHLTKKHFMTQWQALGASDQSARQLAIIIGLFYATGRDVNDILNWRVGKENECDLNQRFEYVRSWLSPNDIYAPDTDSLHLYETKINHLALPFIETLRELLSVHLSAQPSATLGEQLGLKRDDCLDAIKEIFHRWRENGRYPIKLNKVQAALNTELWIMFRHHPSNYVLAGSDAHKAHIISHYQATDSVTLIQRWRDTQHALFQQ